MSVFVVWYPIIIFHRLFSFLWYFFYCFLFARLHLTPIFHFLYNNFFSCFLKIAVFFRELKSLFILWKISILVTHQFTVKMSKTKIFWCFKTMNALSSEIFKQKWEKYRLCDKLISCKVASWSLTLGNHSVRLLLYRPIQCSVQNMSWLTQIAKFFWIVSGLFNFIADMHMIQAIEYYHGNWAKQIWWKQKVLHTVSYPKYTFT